MNHIAEMTGALLLNLLKIILWFKLKPSGKLKAGFLTVFLIKSSSIHLDLYKMQGFFKKKQV